MRSVIRPDLRIELGLNRQVRDGAGR